MKYNKMTILHDPENGKMGDCFRTALSCLLNLEPEQVPHFMADPEVSMKKVWKNVDRWLQKEYGLRYISIPFEPPEYLGVYLAGWSNTFPALTFEVAGESPRGTDHSLVWDGGARKFWDVHPDGGNLVGPMSDGYYRLGFLMPTWVHGQSKTVTVKE